MPGDGDLLERGYPEVRARTAELARPVSEDAVAWLIPADPRDDDTPPSWGVTFADATAGRARELGGQVLVPPTDALWYG